MPWVEGDIRIAEVVGDDDHDVGLGGLCGGGWTAKKRNESKESEETFHFEAVVGSSVGFMMNG
jgi:hypothetical protein